MLNDTRSVEFTAPLANISVILATGLVDDCRNPRIVCVIVAPGCCT